MANQPSYTDFISLPTPAGVGEVVFDQTSSLPFKDPRSASLELLLNTQITKGLRTLLYDFDSEQQAPFYLGKTVADRVVLRAPAYDIENYDANSDRYIKTTIPAAQIILNTILVDVNMDRNIITTPISGRDGTVKEYISNGDYRLDFRGVIANQVARERPTAEVALLAKILTAPVSLEVTSDYLQQCYSISNMVIISNTYTQEEGAINSIYFTFSALSDKPLELQKFKIR